MHVDARRSSNSTEEEKSSVRRIATLLERIQAEEAKGPGKANAVGGDVSELEQLRSELDEYLGAECPYCGELMISRCTYKMFVL